jgi:hypothetical protein
LQPEVYQVTHIKKINQFIRIVDVKNIDILKTYILGSQDNWTAIATEIIETRDGKHILVPNSPKLPTLFADFPLIGSENFQYPCYINSHLFWPNEERSNIVLEHGSHSKIN